MRSIKGDLTSNGGIKVADNKSVWADIWSHFHGPNIGYVEEQYELYLESPESVDASLRELFDQYGAPVWLDASSDLQATSAATSAEDIKKITSAIKFVEAIRRYAHVKAEIYPVGKTEEEDLKQLDPQTHGLTDDDLRNMPANWVLENVPQGVRTAYDAVKYLEACYTGKISFEYDHLSDEDERKWFKDQIETGKYKVNLTNEQKKQLLKRLAHVEGFENFLAKTFVGQKRFSIEGLEAMVPMLDQIVKYVTEDKIDHILMGMAHRGRLSVLAHVLGKPLDKIFSEFDAGSDKVLIPSETSQAINYGWTGDVKYHFGGIKDVEREDGNKTRITLAHNPSHLEFVNPVVEGFTRAVQDDRSEKGYPKQDINKGIPVLIHGDAAFIGEGVVAETLNLSQLDGYKTGGTLHIIANNLLGYTTTHKEGRSTRYSSDLAKGFEIPVLHVNADDPEACLDAVKLAYNYRKTFKKDVLIDLVGYRRYGHNEMDEPRATQPLLYQEIDKHPTITKKYANDLQQEGVIAEGDYEGLVKKVEQSYQEIFDTLTEDKLPEDLTIEVPEALRKDIEEYDTAVPVDVLKTINEDLLSRPEGFSGFKRLDRVFKRREVIFEEGNKADWGTGEALAYATILRDGTPIRLTGQDSERGTFAHRHMVLHDTKTGEKYCVMHGLRDAKASFDIRNSPLSEVGALGFEYGYSVQSPETLVIWEAQFGDFANVAQVMFDQFISSARAKWGEQSSIVLLLPHGYEGAGPEHSSARLERFLQMAAENNWIVAYVTSSAQFFHLMRRQVAMKGTDAARPLVLMTPKSSLLRNERVASPIEEFANGHFEPLRKQPNLEVNQKKAKRLLLGSGKVMIDIEEAIDQSEENFDWLSAYRVEQLYPFPKKELEQVISELPNLEEIVWVQEEPKNMGGWYFVAEYLQELLKDGQTLRCISRPRRSSPAVGNPHVHKFYQNNIVKEAITPSEGGKSSEGH